jgi:S-DNA-T family DNA segregation ATPase FtsK/SpoIIIE
MSTPLLSDRQRAALRDFTKAAADRARAEVDIEVAFQAAQEAAEAELQQKTNAIQAEFNARQEGAVQEFQAASQELTTRFEEAYNSAARDLTAARVKAASRHDADREKTEADFKETSWTVATVLEADRKVAKDQLVERQRYVGTTLQQIETLHDQAVALLTGWQLEAVLARLKGTAQPVGEGEDLFAALQRCGEVVEASLAGLRKLFIPRLLGGHRLTVLVLAGWLALLAPAFLMDKWYYWLAAVSGAAVSIGVALHAWLWATLRAQAVKLYAPLRQAYLSAGPLQKRCLEEAQADYRRQIERARRRKEEAEQQAVAEREKKLREATTQRDTVLRQAEERHQPVIDKATRQRDLELRKAEAKYQRLMADSNARQQREQRAATERHAGLLQETNNTHARDWQALVGRWRQALAEFNKALGEVNAECRRLFPAWEDPSWQPARLVPGGIPFGTLEIGPELIPFAVPRDERLRSLQPPRLESPALLSFPEHGSLLLKAEGEGRAIAVRTLQAVMLRCLTAVPPGKVRFTIIDPVGLGESFAAFTHLSDYEEALIGSRIWTETPHIEQRLADLTEHIENVIQKYLRNQFRTLEEYNAQAGEIAEPYRFLVVANFPAGFSVEAARRLVAIVASGARCGLQTLISVDSKLEPPQHFDPADLERAGAVLVWKKGRFQWQDADFGCFSLRLESPPEAAVATGLLQRVGEAARAAGRVEVPFRSVAPPPEQWWTGDSRPGLRVPLGRAGAVRKQYLELGKGTAQHVLVAGKTGSGKSTLLHALITQLALLYSPEEIELYLVDFKKGVEFKTYAVHELPHARVVAIESEREFGLSVLQRLDVELRRRGELFRGLGVHDLASFRQARGQAMPRVLLVVDEFQEFFVEDDRIAQEAALLLDRLVRQGRAFGIHILLGSQTLGGAYSLARTTIDQMAVRIALQCSEADGHLILSKDNSAARLLSRPGEAIYNDANGLVEGNEIFQTVWLADDQREQCLRQIHDMAQARGVAVPPQVVFEGSAPAAPERNLLLRQALETPAAPARSASLTAWLGEAIAIKDPTAAVFRRQSGSNLLLVGQHGEAALAILATALISLAAQQPAGAGPEVPAFFWLGDAAQDAPTADGLLAELPTVLPQPLRLVGWRDLAAVLGELAAEVDRRHKDRLATGAPRFLFVYGLHHFRDLRRQEDDFGFGRRGDEKAVHPSKHFATIVRDGPAVGVFTLLWCDTLTNLNRFFDRQALRELEMKVLFQMSANDSSTLIDSPAAAKLGLTRALYCTEDQGRVEKFRPYGLPSAAWLAEVKATLHHEGHPEQVRTEGDRQGSRVLKR